MQLHSRLAMYSLLSEFESDLRTVIVDQIANALTPQLIFPGDTYQKLTERLKKDKGGNGNQSDISALIHYSDLGDLEQCLRIHKSLLTKEMHLVLQGFGVSVAKLIPIRNRVMHSRPINFMDLPFVHDFCQSLLLSHSHLFPRLSAAFHRLQTDPTYVLDQSIPQHAEENVFHNLPFPDFDETGFIGRDEQLQLIHKQIKGPFPIISILGEGGLGKTALALRAAYDILEDDSRPFEAIVWSSSKTAQLTTHDIYEIDNALKTSAELLNHTAATLSGVAAQRDPIDEIYAYLQAFRVLLVLDNLENVLDDRIRKFLQDIPSGTKVIITSRVGLQSLDFPITLRPFAESVDLLRAVAKARDVPELVQTSNKTLESFCAKLHHNPLAIKWFVTAVQNGFHPEEIIQDQSLFLEYCMSYVYKHISNDCKLVLAVFQILNKSLGVAELVAYTELAANAVRAALMLLDGANMITMKPVPKTGTFQTTYTLNHLAYSYLSKHHAVTSQMRAKIQKNQRRLQSQIEIIRGKIESNPFSMRTMAGSTNGQIMVCGLLLSAIECVSDRRASEDDFKKALAYLEQAKGISPEFFEVHRVEGYILYKNNHISEAITAYEAAVELKPDHAPLRFWFGQLLLREDDYDRCEEHLREAERLMPNQPAIRIETARLAMYRKDFDTAREMLGVVLSTPGLNDTYRRIGNDLMIQSYIREAEHHLLNRMQTTALPLMEMAKRAYDAVPGECVDEKIKNTVRKALRTAQRCEQMLRDSDLGERAYVIRSWCESISAELAHTMANVIARKGQGLIGNRHEGVVERMADGGRYGFIYVDDYRVQNRVFFHVSNVREHDARRVRSGIRLEFLLVADQDGRLSATEVRVLG